MILPQGRSSGNKPSEWYAGCGVVFCGAGSVILFIGVLVMCAYNLEEGDQIDARCVCLSYKCQSTRFGQICEVLVDATSVGSQKRHLAGVELLGAERLEACTELHTKAIEESETNSFECYMYTQGDRVTVDPNDKEAIEGSYQSGFVTAMIACVFFGLAFCGFLAYYTARKKQGPVPPEQPPEQGGGAALPVPLAPPTPTSSISVRVVQEQPCSLKAWDTLGTTPSGPTQHHSDWEAESHVQEETEVAFGDAEMARYAHPLGSNTGRSGDSEQRGRPQAY